VNNSTGLYLDEFSGKGRGGSIKTGEKLMY
jgi:hypothetical protein